MFMSDKNVPSGVPSKTVSTDPFVGYNEWAFEHMLNQQFNVLKARLLNLADSVARDDKQANSMKGLIKDFVNDSYYKSVRDIADYARHFKIIHPNMGQSTSPLRAESMEDILVK